MIKKILLGVVVIAVLFLIFRNTEIGTNETVENGEVETMQLGGTFTEAFVSENAPAVVLEDSKVVWFGENKIQAKSHTGTLDLASSTNLTFTTNPESGNVFVTSGEFVIDMATLMGENEPEALIDHLKSADFFDVATYPEARFVVTSYSESAVRGMLTMKDVTQEVEISYAVEETNSGYQFLGDVALDRTIWGVKTLSGNFFDNVGDNIIEDTIIVSFNIQTM